MDRAQPQLPTNFVRVNGWMSNTEGYFVLEGSHLIQVICVVPVIDCFPAFVRPNMTLLVYADPILRLCLKTSLYVVDVFAVEPLVLIDWLRSRRNVFWLLLPVGFCLRLLFA